MVVVAIGAVLERVIMHRSVVPEFVHTTGAQLNRTADFAGPSNLEKKTIKLTL